jgi:hypothetical protein
LFFPPFVFLLLKAGVFSHHFIITANNSPKKKKNPENGSSNNDKGPFALAGGFHECSSLLNSPSISLQNPAQKKRTWTPLLLPSLTHP